jgi:ABC-type glycerol-3-phosphate transport system permease component
MTTVTAAFGLIAGQHGGVSPVLIQAGALFVVIPMILLFLAGQRYFRRGLFSGAIKE